MVSAQQPTPTPTSVFTAEQAAAGRAAYQARCAGCHLPDMSGRNEASPLAGANFMNTWRARSTRELYEYISATMPPGGATLGADAYLAITAFILQSNGAAAGTQPLTATTSAPLAAIATGRARTRCPQAHLPHGAPDTRTAPVAPGAPAAPSHPPPPPWPDRHRRGERLPSSHRRDAAQSAARRLADDAAQLPGLEPQPAHRDHDRQRQGPAARVGVGDERRRRESADAARARRRSCISPTR